MEETTFQPTFSGNTSQKKSRKLLFAVVLIVVLTLLFGSFKLMGSKNNKSSTAEITPTPTEYQFPTDTPAPVISKAASSTAPTPTLAPTTNPIDKTTGLDRSKLSIEIKNGSGQVGAAGKAADVLKGLGYKISATGNADNYNFTDVTIQVKSSMSQYVSLLKKDLGFNYTVGTASADLAADSSTDAVVIIGK